MRKTFSLPVKIFQDKTFDDERFLKLRVKVMHAGVNRNNSRFRLPVINAAEDSLPNIPLLAFIKKVDGTDQSDFGGHEFEIKVSSDNELKFVYLGRPIGTIPETNNYQLEVDEEDGTTWVVTDAYIWTQYANDALDIFLRDGTKKVSMEASIQDYEWTEDDVMDIKSYKYLGVVALGEDVPEGMLGARAEVFNFSADAISKMLYELNETLEEGREEICHCH